jgi:cytochrome bd-type quinol oxidase subunit 1
MDDVFLLSRSQFALTIRFHYIFPPLSIGGVTELEYSAETAEAGSW